MRDGEKMFWIGFGVGLIVGGNVGLFVVALLSAASRSEEGEQVVVGLVQEPDSHWPMFN